MDTHVSLLRRNVDTRRIAVHRNRRNRDDARIRARPFFAR